MLANPECPVCASNRWKDLGRRTYRKNDMVGQDRETRTRMSVLFDIWADHADEVTLTSILCDRCGFVCYRPRPTELDIGNKYAYLAENPETSHEISRQLETDKARSDHLLAALRPYISAESTILDFGGGNGRLMISLIEAGFRCSLIDFPGEKVHGIEHIGSRLDDIPEGRRFDVIVASHVLEHLADPYRIVRELRAFLSHDGLLFVEVPLEIWRRPPLPKEPVTHVNYFMEPSLTYLLQRAGYRVSSCREVSYITEDGGVGLAIRAFAQADETAAQHLATTDHASTAHDLLEPNILQRVSRALRHPEHTYQRIRRQLLVRYGKTPILWKALKYLPARRVPKLRP